MSPRGHITFSRANPLKGHSSGTTFSVRTPKFFLICVDTSGRRYFWMSAHAQPTFLFASTDTDLLTAIEPTLLAAGARVDIVLSAQAALASISGPRAPSLILLDAQLPGMPMGQLLAAVRAEAESARLPVVLIADTVTQEWYRSPCRGRRRRSRAALCRVQLLAVAPGPGAAQSAHGQRA